MKVKSTRRQSSFVRLETTFLNAHYDVSEEDFVTAQVMHGEENGSEELVCRQQVVDVGAGVVLTREAVARVGDRAEVVLIAGVHQVQGEEITREGNLRKNGC